MQPKHSNTISSLSSSKKSKNNISFIIDIPNNELEYENINCSVDAVDNSILSKRENGINNNSFTFNESIYDYTNINLGIINHV